MGKLRAIRVSDIDYSGTDWGRPQRSLAEEVTDLVTAVEALVRKEEKRIGVARLDWTYHGCDKDWRAALIAVMRVQRGLGLE